MAIEVDVGDVDVVTIHLHLYEADDQNLWHEMAKNEKLNQLLDPEKFDWVNAIKPLKDIPKVCSKAQTKEEMAICVIRQLVKAASFAVDYLKQDDLSTERCSPSRSAPRPRRCATVARIRGRSIVRVDSTRSPPRSS